MMMRTLKKNSSTIGACFLGLTIVVTTVGATGDAVRVATSGGTNDAWTQRLYDERDLWAYQPLRRIERPSGPDADAHPIDGFIARKLREVQLPAAGVANRRALIRRATLDLTGLPPTAEQIEAFVADRSPDAFERVIERLLRSERYGERMAQHWLDVVRYADTDGFSNDYDRPNAWRYRDYVIRAFNDDKPYDRFIIEQLAGDELDDSVPDNLIAVGFLRMGPWEHTGMSVAAETRQQYLDDVTNIVGETFLAQGLRCASCHDHKFDPVPTRDYYRMQAVFAPVQFADRPVGFRPWENTGGFEAGRARIDRLIEHNRSADAELREKEQSAARRWLVERGREPLTLAQIRKLPEDQRPPRNIGLSNDDLGVKKVYYKRYQLLERQALRYEPLCMSVYSGPRRVVRSGRLHEMPEQVSGEAPEVRVLSGGSLRAPREAVEPGALSLIELGSPNPLSAIPGEMNGRRLALARWIAHEDNPLTARVIVNRIWQWHFGRGLAANPNNFGKMGGKPSHPELLDWLAVYFVEHGWSFKEMHRLIMTSRAYRRSTEHPSPSVAERIDPDNVLLCRFTPRRLTAEELRDATLHASGQLNVEMGGPPIYPEINLEVALQPRHIMGTIAPAYQPSRTPEERNRRTIYAARIRTLHDPMLEVFDRPGEDVSCERRDGSTVTPQAFSLFNSRNSYDRALGLALRASESSVETGERVRSAFRFALGREPTPKELRRGTGHVRTMTDHHRSHAPAVETPPTSVEREMVEEMTGLTFTWHEQLDVYAEYDPDPKPWDVDAETRALADLCLVLLNTNEFIYVY